MMADALDRVRERRRLEESGATTAQLEAFDREHHGDPIRTGPATSRDHHEMRARARAAESPTHEAYKAGEREGRRNARPSTPRRPTSPVELVQPGIKSATGGMKVVGMALWLVALYVALESAPQLSGFLGGITRSLVWFRSPTTTIPHKGQAAAGKSATPTTTTTTTTTTPGTTSAVTGGNVRPGAPAPVTA